MIDDQVEFYPFLKGNKLKVIISGYCGSDGKNFPTDKCGQ